MSAALVHGHPNRDRALLCFIVLQLLDFVTTLAVFSRGGSELNPVIRGLLPLTGPVVAVLISKALLLLLVWRVSQRNWILYFGNLLYAVIVTWNFLSFFSLLKAHLTANCVPGQPLTPTSVSSEPLPSTSELICSSAPNRTMYRTRHTSSHPTQMPRRVIFSI